MKFGPTFHFFTVARFPVPAKRAVRASTESAQCAKNTYIFVFEEAQHLEFPEDTFR
jgi:hypothetical protein